MTTLAPRAERPTRRREGRHAAYGRLLADQFSHNLRDLWRSRIAFVFTLVFPLTWLVVLGLVMGSDTLDEATGVSIMQFLTPTAAAMGILFSAYPTVATALAAAREGGVLKRIHGTPLPAWVFLAGRIAAAVVFAFASFVVMIAAGVLFFDVDLVGRTALATVVTSMVAIACFAAIGLAIAALASSAETAQAASIASTVVLAFLSGLMGFGDMPGWANRIAGLFPVRPFNEALRDQFNPVGTGAGWDLGALAIMVVWGLGAAVVAERAFQWDPAVRHTTGRPAALPVTTATPFQPADPGANLSSTPRRGTGHQLRDQIRWATRETLRNPGSMFFAIAMPLTLFAFMLSVYDRKSTGPAGEPIDVYTLCGLASWGAAVVGFVYLPEAIAGARESGVLKRLRGTPLNPVSYLAGHAVSALSTALITGLLLVVEGLTFFDVRIAMSGLLLAAAILVLGSASVIAAGFLLASLAPSRKAASAVGLGILFPVSFISNVFVAGDMPAWLDAVGSVLPLKHLAGSLVGALDPAGPSVSWTGVAVMTGWLLVCALLSVRLFRWETRR